MKVVVMAGGTGSRLRPYLANGINKHLIPVHDRPLLHHLLERLRESGATSVLMLLNWRNPGLILESIGTGEQWNLPVFYGYSTAGVAGEVAGGGPGRELIYAEPWVEGESFALVLGDSFYFSSLDLRDAAHQEEACLWAMKLSDTWDDYRKYGQIVESGGFVTQLYRGEKRVNSLVQTGAWCFPPDVFDRIRALASTYGSQEVRITDIAQCYVAEGRMRAHIIPPDSFIDCGTPDAVQRIAARLASA